MILYAICGTGSSRGTTRKSRQSSTGASESEGPATKAEGSIGNVSRFLENARKFTEIPALTCEILHTFIQRVEVGERAKRYDQIAPQEIRIYYRDIGLIDELPKTMMAEQEKPFQTEAA
ncbi:MAG: DUF4368 domain-containing protein [Oscillospiraceae bacterium]|nr:DUF4368 domain-containing protein [Oscillospiraceae bacterium]